MYYTVRYLVLYKILKGSDEMVNVRTPQIADLETAIQIYYGKIMLFNDDVSTLFPSVKSRGTITKLKRKAREYMTEHGIMPINAQAVNTEAAFAAWGIDIQDLLNRQNKLKEMK